MSSDLVAFVEARLNDDEQDARNRRGIWPSPGVTDDGALWLHIQRGGNAVITWYTNPPEGRGDMAALRRWAEPAGSGWTGDRALREVEAKRAALTRWRAALAVWESARAAELASRDHNNVMSISAVRATNQAWAAYLVWCDALKCLGIAWSDHPDYRQEWTP